MWKEAVVAKFEVEQTCHLLGRAKENLENLGTPISVAGLWAEI
jgi:hypothetical protein